MNINYNRSADKKKEFSSTNSRTRALKNKRKAFKRQDGVEETNLDPVNRLIGNIDSDTESEER